MNEEHVGELQGHTSIHPPERTRAALWHGAEAFLLVLAMNNSGSTHSPLKYARFKIKHLLPSDRSWLRRSWLRGCVGLPKLSRLPVCAGMQEHNEDTLGGTSWQRGPAGLELVSWSILVSRASCSGPSRTFGL